MLRWYRWTLHLCRWNARGDTGRISGSGKWAAFLGSPCGGARRASLEHHRLASSLIGGGSSIGETFVDSVNAAQRAQAVSVAPFPVDSFHERVEMRLIRQ